MLAGDAALAVHVRAQHPQRLHLPHTHDEEGGCGRKRAKTRVGVCRVFRIELCSAGGARVLAVHASRLSPAARGLDTSGQKAQLVARVLSVLQGDGS